MYPVILAAHAPEFDLGRVVFVIMLLLGGFFQWLMNWWRKKRAEAELMRQAPPSPAELQARERAWQRQAGAGGQAPLQPAGRNPMEDLLKTFRDFTTPGIAPPPLVAPPLPARKAIPVVESPRPGLPPTEVPSAPVAIVQQRPRHPLAVKLGAIGGLRQAVLFREILGPPKALQTADDHLI